MKKFTKSTQQKMSIEYKKGVPSYINKKFISKKVDAAFISSIRARKAKKLNLGIVARDEVLSVLVIPRDEFNSDIESETSNLLAKVLKLNGEVLIGDKALRYYLEKKPMIDMAKEWKNKTNLPFVFALLCYNKDYSYYKKIEKNFLDKKIKIPQYILEASSKRTKIAKKDIINYLKHISYRVDKKANMGLKKFYKEVDRL